MSVAAINQEMEEINSRLRERFEFQGDVGTTGFCTDAGDVEQATLGNMKMRKRVSKVGGGKPTALAWSPCSKKVATLSQQGSIILYDAFTKYMLHFIAHDQKLMDIAFDPTGDLIAIGGLDNILTIYSLEDNNTGGEDQKPRAEMKDCEGYVGSIAFMGSEEVLVGSGDRTCRIFDVETEECVQTYAGHDGDCSAVALNPINQDMWVTGSCKDGTCKIWDRRQNYAVCTFPPSLYPCKEDLEHTPITALSFMRNGNAFAAGTDSGQIKVFDVRNCSKQLINILTYNEDSDPWPAVEIDAPDPEDAASEYYDLKKERIADCGITSMDFSASGRLIFTGHGDGTLMAYDILQPRGVVWENSYDGGDDAAQCSGVRLSPDGKALGACYRSNESVMLEIFA